MMRNKKDQKLKAEITRFLEFYKNQLTSIKNMDIGESANLFSKILYSSLLDSLSISATHPNRGNKNRERIIEFIRNFCNWPDCDKVSLTHLKGLLAMTANNGWIFQKPCC